MSYTRMQLLAPLGMPLLQRKTERCKKGKKILKKQDTTHDATSLH